MLPSLPQELRTADGYREVAEMLNTAGEISGRRQHSGSATTTMPSSSSRWRGPLPAARSPGTRFWSNTSTRGLVDLEIDFHWSAVGGADAAALFAEHPGRFALCHVKDHSSDGRMADVGAGEIDWAALFSLSSQAGLRHYFVEHDQPGDPLASVEASYRYLS